MGFLGSVGDVFSDVGKAVGSVGKAVGGVVGDVFSGFVSPIASIISPLTSISGVGDLLGLGASLLGSSMQAQGAKDTNVASAHEAALNRDFQASQSDLQRQWTERLSNTAHQREVIDLKNAGLNPILSAGGTGASSAGGATAGSVSIPTFQNPFQGFGELANAARRLQEVEKQRIEYERDLAREKTNTERKAQANLEAQAYSNWQAGNKFNAEAQITSTKDAIERWGLAWIKPQELKLLQSQTANQLSQSSMNSAYGAKAQTDKLVQDLILNRHSLSKEIEPYTQLGKEAGDTASKIGEGLWQVMPYKKTFKPLIFKHP